MTIYKKNYLPEIITISSNDIYEKSSKSLISNTNKACP